MKKIFLAFIVFHLVTFAASAQIQKGSVLFGGYANFSNDNTEQAVQGISQNIKTNGFSFDPRIGFAVGNNWVIGSTLSIGTSKTIIVDETVTSTNFNSGTRTTKANAFGVALFARKYLPFGDKFSAFAELSSGATWNNSTSTYVTSSITFDSDSKYNSYQTSLSTGLAYFPKNWMAIELSTNLVSFTNSTQDSDNDSSNRRSNSFDLGFNTAAINLGLSFFLKNK